MLPLSIQKAEAIENKTSLPRTSDEVNTIPSSQSNTASSDACLNYNPSTRTIAVSCGSSIRLSDIDNKLHNSGVLTK
jgi:hypothetical protein